MTPKTRTKRHLASLLCTVEVLLVHARSLYSTVHFSLLIGSRPLSIRVQTGDVSRHATQTLAHSFVGSLADLGLLFKKKKKKLVSNGYMCLLLSTNLWRCWQMGQELASVTSWLLSANCRVVNISSWTPCSLITSSVVNKSADNVRLCVIFVSTASMKL